MNQFHRVDLLTNAAGAGTNGSWVKWEGGKGFFAADGTFSGSTIKLQFKSPKGNAIDLGTTTNLAAAGGAVFEYPPGDIRAVITGGTATGITAIATRIPN